MNATKAPEIRMAWHVGPEGHPWLTQVDEHRGRLRIEPHKVEFNWWASPFESEPRWYVTVIGPLVRFTDDGLSRVMGRVTYWSNEDQRIEKMLTSAPAWVRALVDQAFAIIGDPLSIHIENGESR